MISEHKEYVIMLHGIMRSYKHMQPLSNYLTKSGFEVINYNYPSTKYSIEKLIDIIWQDIRSKIDLNKRKVNFVGFSMGGLLVRGIINKYQPQNLHRVVLLGTPNHGSEVADYMKNFFLYKILYGPAGQQLGVKDSSKLAKILGMVNYELGVIAGNFSVDPISSLMIKGIDDGKVSIESTKIQGMHDHITLSVSHCFFPSNKNVMSQTLAFLRTGRFMR